MPEKRFEYEVAADSGDYQRINHWLSKQGVRKRDYEVKRPFSSFHMPHIKNLYLFWNPNHAVLLKLRLDADGRM